MSAQEIIEKKKELERKIKDTCDSATSALKSDLEKLELELKERQLEAQKQHEETFKEMAIKVGEMFRMAFELYTIHGIDLKLELTNHVQWLEIDSDTYDYANCGDELCALVPDPSGEFQECYERVKGIYEAHG